MVLVDGRDVERVVEATKNRILAHQRSDGAFVFCCELTPLSDAVMVIFLHMLGYSSDPLIPGLCQSLLRQQNADGGWTAYPDQAANNTITVLAYFALLLSGVPKSSSGLMKARAYIQAHGGITEVSTYGKVFLAVSGQLPWSIFPQAPTELVFFKPSDPVSLFDVSSPARVHLPSTLLLSHLNFSFHVPERLSLRDLIASGITLPKRRRHQVNMRAVERGKTFLLERLEPNATLAGYLSSTIQIVFALVALGYSRQHPLIQRALRSLREMTYRRAGSIHQQYFTSTVWDTSLSMQALTAAGMPATDARVVSAAQYLFSRQHHQVSDWVYRAPRATVGAFGFSDVNTRYPDVDDTAAAVKALYPFRTLAGPRWRRAAQWMLAMQNDDGGWSAFDRNCNKQWLALLIGDDLGGALLDPSTPDITGRVLDTIGSTHIPGSAAVARGVKWLLSQQRADGSWFGKWGISFIYGTWLAVQGLRACGISPDHPALRRASAWFREIQNADGGFGESCQSDELRTYVPLGLSTPSQTAWAFMGMQAASGAMTPEMDQAARYLLESAHPHGGWRETYPTGAGVAGLAYLRYHSYPYIWPLSALSAYRSRNQNG